MGLAVVRGLRERRVPTGPEELVDFETDVLAGFVLARASAGLADGTIRSDIGHLEQTRTWFGRPLWDMAFPDISRCGQRFMVWPAATQHCVGRLSPSVLPGQQVNRWIHREMSGKAI
jgi:hypothetical protein